MIVTFTRNADGLERVYLGGKGSLECWIEPKTDKTGWTFHLDEAVTGNRLSDADRRDWAVHTLLALADVLGVAPDALAAVPFEAIAALHESDPYAGRRVASPRRRTLEQGFMATAPHIRRPTSDFVAPGASRSHRFR
ncbi:MAG: hypothetical protein AB7F78_13055 [Hyphomicrobiaceae bacterium]